MRGRGSERNMVKCVMTELGGIIREVAEENVHV